MELKILEKTSSTNFYGDKTKQAMVLFDGTKYSVSDNGKETLIFNLDSQGRPDNAVGGMFNLTLEYVLNNFETVLKAGIKEHFLSVFGLKNEV